MSTTLLNLAWLIPAFPFLAFVIIPLVTYRNRKLSHGLVIGGIAIAFLLSQIVFWTAVTLPEGTLPFESESIHWLSAGVERFRLAVYIDPATAIMLFMVPLVCMMIFIYSVGYMNFGTPDEDKRYSRFFAYLSLFATGMLGMLVFNNLLAFFIFWEIMGTCSYLLIGFWYEKKYPDPNKITPKEAGLKAFIVTKIGDLFFMIGLALLYAKVGSLAYSDIFSPETLEYLATTGFMGTGFPLAAVIALLLFGGTVGKSAQFPLHVWLPDAMEGPTPVSALIHAATMVSAGVFLVVRCFPIFTAAAEYAHVNPVHMTIVAGIGAFTAIFSSLMAIAQDDVKGVLAYSTISQLGYMIAALGLGAYVAGAFHLITHAFFKALLFLSSGSVIHGMEHGHHHAHESGHKTHEKGHEEKWFNPNDMMNMGGLWKRMPRTFWPFLIGGLALSGFPLITAGFWSKDEILAQVYATPVVFWTLTVAAGMTAFYTARQICLTFFGEPRTEAARHAPESVPSMTVPLAILAFFAVTLGWAGIPENLPGIGGIIPNWFHHFVISTIETGSHEAEHSLRVAGHLSEAVHGFEWAPLLLGMGFGLGGLFLGWLVYGRKPLKAGQMDPVEAAMRKVWLGWLYDAMRNRFYFDELYQATFVKGSIWLADVFDAFDYGQPVKKEIEGEIVLVRNHGVVDGLVNGVGKIGRIISDGFGWFDAKVVDGLVNLVGLAGKSLSIGLDLFDLKVVDGAVNGVGAMTKAAGRPLRRIQGGLVQNYLLIASMMVLGLVVTFFVIIFQMP
ncbi:MAG: NADH-quinone oxidoreductase subunit L [Chloroflexi bacterium]|nr:NADH-quinone oxidoreductase subunit L [Chloroflexota bacterium]